jgi:hypothetical protein
VIVATHLSHQNIEVFLQENCNPHSSKAEATLRQRKDSLSKGKMPGKNTFVG